MKKGCKYGTHRVLEPKGVLPQPAEKIDNEMELYDNEILINVKTLNIDSASFTQIKKEANNKEERIAEIMKKIVSNRGKHHNPITGSGGMLIGEVEKVGENLKNTIDLEVGDKIATLVSLSLTPLKIDKIKEIRKETDQVDIEGKAILFESGIYANLPENMSENLALAVLDVAGAPAQTAKLVKPGDSVLIIGAGGKSGTLCLHEAKKRAGVSGQVIALEYSQEGCKRVKDLDLADVIIQADATKPPEVLEKINGVTDNKLVDLTINCVNIPKTEMSCILATKDTGKVYFFSMATSFTAAALGAEGVGKDTEMIIGNGYTKDHSEIALQIIRENNKIKNLFEEIYL